MGEEEVEVMKVKQVVEWEIVEVEGGEMEVEVEEEDKMRSSAGIKF